MSRRLLAAAAQYHQRRHSQQQQSQSQSHHVPPEDFTAWPDQEEEQEPEHYPLERRGRNLVDLDVDLRQPQQQPQPQEAATTTRWMEQGDPHVSALAFSSSSPPTSPTEPRQHSNSSSLLKPHSRLAASHSLRRRRPSDPFAKPPQEEDEDDDDERGPRRLQAQRHRGHHVSHFEDTPQQQHNDKELSPEQGAVQFLPALSSSSPGASWDQDDDKDAEPQWREEKKEDGLMQEEEQPSPPHSPQSHAVSRPRSVVSVASTSMAHRARQYKQLRKQQQQQQSGRKSLANHNSTPNPPHASGSASVILGPGGTTTTTTTSSLLQSAVASLKRSPSHSENRPKSPRPKSPMAFLKRPKSPSNTNHRPKSPRSLLSRHHRPKSPLASKQQHYHHRPLAHQVDMEEEDDEQQPQQSEWDPAARPLEHNETEDQDTLELPPQEHPDIVSPQPPQQAQPVRRSTTPTRSSLSSSSRVSRLASLFAGSGKPSSPPRPQRPISPATSPYNRLPRRRSHYNITPSTVPTTNPEDENHKKNEKARQVEEAQAWKDSNQPEDRSKRKEEDDDDDDSYDHDATKQEVQDHKHDQDDDDHHYTHDDDDDEPVEPVGRTASSTSGSSAYVGWPGTQDRRGKLVALQSEEETLSSAPGAPTMTSRSVPSTSTPQQTATTHHHHPHPHHPHHAVVTPSPQAPRSAVGYPETTHTDDDDGMARMSSNASSPARRLRQSLSSARCERESLDHQPPDDDNDNDPDRVPTRSAGGALLRRRLRSSRQQQQQQHYLHADNNKKDEMDFGHEQQQEQDMEHHRDHNHNFKAAPLPSRTMTLANGRHWGKPQQPGGGYLEDDLPSSPSTAFSKTSSAYFTERDVNPLAYPDFHPHPSNAAGGPPFLPHMASTSATGLSSSFNPYGGGGASQGRSMSEAAAASVLRSQQQHYPQQHYSQEPQGHSNVPSITAESLAANNHWAPPHRTYSAGSKGFRGLLDKTQDFPALMDLNDSDNSSRGNSSHTSRQTHAESDVFDGIATNPMTLMEEPNTTNAASSGPNGNATTNPQGSNANNPATHLLQQPHKFVRSNSRIKKAHYPEAIAEEQEDAALLSPVATKESRSNDEEPHQDDMDEEGGNFTSLHSDQDQYKMVLLGGGLTAIQSSAMGYVSRQTPSDYDEALSTSEVESNGFTRTPSVAEMMNAGKRGSDAAVLVDSKGSSSIPSHHFAPSNDDEDDNNNHHSLAHRHHSRGNNEKSYRQHHYQHPHEDIDRYEEEDDDVDDDEGSEEDSIDPYSDGTSVVQSPRSSRLAKYYVEPDHMKKLLRVYRQLSDRITRKVNLTEFERLEDENKAFALLEMRSRIMEKDMERGLERRGGTVVVDDLVLTAYNRTAHRIRDAVIVAKAWRDGASPKDVVNTALLTRRPERTYFIRRPLHPHHSHRHHSSASSVVSGFSTLSSGGHNSSRHFWEAVKWIDDTDFMLYRCPSLGPRNLRGFEMFTIGDCQSILLKLTNERCAELRKALNIATKEQLVAEELMKEEEADADNGFMTESEMAYLSAMEKVKTVSKQLVVAEQAFTLVRDRIEKLIAKYEALLVRIENDTSVCGASSVVTYESSLYTDHDEEREAQMWARRAKRAELKAEVAAREALMARQEADWIRQESQQELERVQLKLAELQSEASTAISQREHKAVFENLPTPASAVAQRPPPSRPSANDAFGKTSHQARSLETTHNQVPPGTAPSATGTQPIDQQKIEGVKQRFRDRMAAKKKQTPTSPQPSMDYPVPGTSNSVRPHNRLASSSLLSSSMPSHNKNIPPPPSRSHSHNPHAGRHASLAPRGSTGGTSQTSGSSGIPKHLARAAGEEMFSHLDFYERSLKAVQEASF